MYVFTITATVNLLALGAVLVCAAVGGVSGSAFQIGGVGCEATRRRADRVIEVP